ncbi:MAG: hypothetical protein WKF60_10050 [Ilumatobacter sp.]
MVAVRADLHQRRASIVGIGQALDQVVGLQGGDHLADHRSRQALDFGEIAEPDRAPVRDRPEHRCLRGGELGVLLAQHAVQRMHDRPQPARDLVPDALRSPVNHAEQRYHYFTE